MERFYKFEQFVTQLLEGIITLLFFFILSLTIILVVLRYGFNSTIVGGNEAMDYLFIYTTALGAAISIGKSEHIKITYLIDKLNPISRRIVDIVNYLLVGLVNAIMVWHSIPWIQTTGNAESPVLRIPTWMIEVSVPIGCSLVILYCLNHILLELFGTKLKTAGGES